MLNIIKKSWLMIFFILSACAGFSSNSEQNDEAPKKIATAKINIQLGMAYFDRHDAYKAKQKFLLALDQAPTIPETWYSMAYFLESTGDKSEAQKYYLKAIALDPRRGEAQNNYGTFLCRKGDYAGSIQHFLLAVQDPRYLDVAGAYENAGLCASRIPDRKLAIGYFKRALQQDPGREISKIELKKLVRGT